MEVQERGNFPAHAEGPIQCRAALAACPALGYNCTERASHNCKMETWRCWDLSCCHLHPAPFAPHSSEGAACICTPSSSWLVEGVSLATCSLFTGQEKCSRSCFAMHVKLQFYWIPIEKCNHQPVFKILVLPCIKHGCYPFFLLPHTAGAFHSPFPCSILENADLLTSFPLCSSVIPCSFHW